MSKLPGKVLWTLRKQDMAFLPSFKSQRPRKSVGSQCRNKAKLTLFNVSASMLCAGRETFDDVDIS